MTPELSRIFRLERISDGMHVLVEATPAERAAVAERMAVPEIQQLSCTFRLSHVSSQVISATGTLRAQVTQECCVSLEPFPVTLEEAFRIRFVPAGTEAEDLDLDAEDEIPYADSQIDLGEATAEQLALALDPFPRKPDVDLPAEAQSATGPFAELAKLRRAGT